MTACVLLLLLAAPPRGLYRFTARLDGTDASFTGEMLAHADGALELVPHERHAEDESSVRLFGRGIGTWRRRPSGVVEATAQLYAYTTAEQPDEPSDLLFVCAADGDGVVRGCIFAAEGAQPQVGTVRAEPILAPEPALPPAD